MTHTPPALPKPNSGAFKTLWAEVKEDLDLPRMVVVLEGALDRRSLEELMRKISKGKALRPRALPKEQLVGVVANAMQTERAQAFAIFRALDKSCSRERHIMSSMSEDGLDARLNDYKAIDFRRERARLIWALLRDGRQAHREAGVRVLVEAFAGITQAQSLKEDVVDSGDDAVQRKTLRKQLDRFAAISSQQNSAEREEHSALDRAEEERSALLLKLAMRERALKEAEVRCQLLETERKEFKEQIRALSEDLRRVDPDRMADVQAERDALRTKMMALQRKVDHAERLSELEDENRALQGENEQLRTEIESYQSETLQLERRFASRQRLADGRTESLRAALKKARQIIAQPREAGASEGEAEEERIGVFVDAANISASARRSHGGGFDFISFLPDVVGKRRKVVAVAFVVEGSGDQGGHAAFVRALRGAGYEVRSKKARVHSDGTRKADWDMGIAMEILDVRNRVDTVVLCSGDGDFAPLVRRLKRWNKRVELRSFRASTDTDLIGVVDDYAELEGDYRVSPGV